MKKIFYLSVIVSSIFIYGCINEDFENTLNNTILFPEYSIPLGTTEYPLHEFNGIDSSSVPGDIGTVFFDNKPFPLDSQSWHRGDLVTFNITSAHTLRKNIIELTFHVLVYNYFPTDVEIQCNFLDLNKRILFSAFPGGSKTIKGGTINSEGNVNEGNEEIIEVKFTQQQIVQLKDIRFFQLASEIKSTLNGTPARFYSEKDIKIIAGVRIKLRGKVDDL